MMRRWRCSGTFTALWMIWRVMGLLGRVRDPIEASTSHKYCACNESRHVFMTFSEHVTNHTTYANTQTVHINVEAFEQIHSAADTKCGGALH